MGEDVSIRADGTQYDALLNGVVQINAGEYWLDVGAKIAEGVNWWSPRCPVAIAESYS